MRPVFFVCADIPSSSEISHKLKLCKSLPRLALGEATVIEWCSAGNISLLQTRRRPDKWHQRALKAWKCDVKLALERFMASKDVHRQNTKKIWQNTLTKKKPFEWRKIKSSEKIFFASLGFFPHQFPFFYFEKYHLLSKFVFEVKYWKSFHFAILVGNRNCTQRKLIPSEFCYILYLTSHQNQPIHSCTYELLLWCPWGLSNFWKAFVSVPGGGSLYLGGISRPGGRGREYLGWLYLGELYLGGPAGRRTTRTRLTVQAGGFLKKIQEWEQDLKLIQPSRFWNRPRRKKNWGHGFTWKGDSWNSPGKGWKT